MENKIDITEEKDVMYEAGLVLEGGGMRGLYTAGVLDFFIDKGILIANAFPVLKHLLVYYFAYGIRNVSKEYPFNNSSVNIALLP